MTTFAPTIEAYFTERLITQRQASPRTIAAYRDSLRMLLVFAQDRTGKTPSQLDVSDVDATLVGAFLTHLEQDRHNSARTRNTRLAAIHSLFRYAAYRHPEHAQTIQRVLAIPSKRYDKRELDYLEVAEVDALLAAPDRTTWIGRRDHMLLVLAVQTGLRVSELTHLTIADLELGPGAHVRCHGKGRKDRATPLTKQTVALLRQWMKERSGAPNDPVFTTSRGQLLSVDGLPLESWRPFGPPDSSVGHFRPGRLGRWPPRLRRARAMRASGDLKPNAILVISRIFVLVDSIRPLDRLCSMAARILVLCLMMLFCSFTNDGIRQRRAQLIHRSRASTAAS